MKKLLVLIPLLFSGCALYDAYFMAKFDVNEYQYITRIRTQAQLGSAKCGTADVIENVKYIHAVAKEFKNYAEKIPHNENAYNLATTLTEVTSDLYTRYQSDKPPSAVYCKAKFAAIERSSENIQTVIGAKPR
jgi:hypothetical protein